MLARRALVAAAGRLYAQGGELLYGLQRAHGHTASLRRAHGHTASLRRVYRVRVHAASRHGVEPL
jgi:hypothetical protein